MKPNAYSGNKARDRLGAVLAGGIMAGAGGTAFGQESGAAGVELPEPVVEIVGAAEETLGQLAATETATTASDTVVQWIESIGTVYHPWVNWVLVAIGVSLFVSHIGQLVFGKLWVALRHRGWNWSEILNDLLVCAFAGLAMPAVLIIPVGYGSFIGNPVAVLSAAGVGVLMGVYLYSHGVRQESLAQKGKVEAETAESA